MNKTMQHMAMRLGARGYRRQTLGSNGEVLGLGEDPRRINETANREGMRVYRLDSTDIKRRGVNPTNDERLDRYVFLLPTDDEEVKIHGRKHGGTIVHIHGYSTTFGSFDKRGKPIGINQGLLQEVFG